MITTFDPTVIQTFADELYVRARWITIKHFVTGACIGILAGFFANLGAYSDNRLYLGAILAATCGTIGASMGASKAFDLKLQAQVALCHLQIERNTREYAIKGTLPPAISVGEGLTSQQSQTTIP